MMGQLVLNSCSNLPRPKDRVITRAKKQWKGKVETQFSDVEQGHAREGWLSHPSFKVGLEMKSR